MGKSIVKEYEHAARSFQISQPHIRVTYVTQNVYL